VNAHKTTLPTGDEGSEPSNLKSTAATTDDAGTTDPDLQRAKDLLELHYGVKVKYQEEGLDGELQRAREDVERVSRELSMRG
jgi:hypothetical protein